MSINNSTLSRPGSIGTENIYQSELPADLIWIDLNRRQVMLKDNWDFASNVRIYDGGNANFEIVLNGGDANG